MISTESTVFIVEDSHIMRQCIQSVLDTHNIQSISFSSAAQFLSYYRNTILQTDPAPCCLLSHFYPVDMSGLELFRQIANAENSITTLFYCEKIPLEQSMQAIREGAIDFLVTPFCRHSWLAAIQRALYRDANIKNWQKSVHHVKQKFSQLTPREKEVFDLVATGLMNKQIAWKLNICIKTVKVHRAHVMKKMQAKSLADLVRQSETLKQVAFYSLQYNYRLDTAI